ncbi:transmembrane protein 101 isoform X1 [Loxodonta africana]|uniref:transmembrane protein 101 isoform X1 n=2 Tax=Loxodonta africana TaxID=9785 RepID=UPI00054037C9|nr:transmembrane protein 101 isoform X1 [Loxodonta africana]
MASKVGSRRWVLQLIMQLGSVLLTRCPFWGCFSQLMLYAERAEARRKPDIPVPYLYFDMGAAVLCASFMSFGVKRRWFALGAALQLAISTYAAYIGGYVHYGDWLKVRMYSRTVAIIGGFLVLASGAGELYRRKPRSRSLQSTGQVFLGIYLICVASQSAGESEKMVCLQAYSLQHSKEDRLAYLNQLPGGELMIQLFFVLYGILALAFLSGYYVTLAAQILAVLLPPVILLIDGNVTYWHNTRRVEFWNQMKLLGESVGIFGAAIILATDG